MRSENHLDLDASRIAETRDCPNRLELFEITRKAATVVQIRSSNLDLVNFGFSVSPNSQSSPRRTRKIISRGIHCSCIQIFKGIQRRLRKLNTRERASVKDIYM